MSAKTEILNRFGKILNFLCSFLKDYASKHDDLKDYANFISQVPRVYENDKHRWMTNMINVSNDKWLQIPVNKDSKVDTELIRKTVIDFNVFEIIISNESVSTIVGMFIDNDNLENLINKIISELKDDEISAIYQCIVRLIRLCIKYIHLERNPVNQIDNYLYEYEDIKYPNLNIEELSKHYLIENLDK